MLSYCSHFIYTVSSVQSSADLLIGMHESLELDVEVLILMLEDTAMLVQSIDLTFNIVVSIEDVLIVESDIILILSGNHKLIFNSSQSVLPLEDLSGKISVTSILSLGLSSEIRLVGELAIQISLESMDLGVESRVVILGSSHLDVGTVVGLTGSSELELLGIGEFSKFVSSFLGLEEIVVDSLDSSIVVLAFSFFESDTISKSVDLILVLGLFLTELTKLEGEVVGVLSHGISLVTLGGNLSREGDALLLPSGNLISDSANFRLKLVVVSILLVQEEPKILDFFSKSVDSHNVLIMTIVIVVVLHELLIL